jgi:hypothetical protein
VNERADISAKYYLPSHECTTVLMELHPDNGDKITQEIFSNKRKSQSLKISGLPEFLWI